MTKLKHTFKTDILFKTLFEKYPHLLKSLVSNLLGIQKESISRFELKNQDIPPDFVDNKFCRVDINMEIDGQKVNLEVQVEDDGDFTSRALYYWSRIFSNSLLSGQIYSDLPRTIVISIVDFVLYENLNGFHSEFIPLEITRYFPLNDKMSIHFFELKKLPDVLDKGNRLNLWLALFRANTEEEIEAIQSLGVTEMNDAIKAYKAVKSSPEFQALELRRDLAGHDEAQAVYSAEKRGEAKGRLEGRHEGRLEGMHEGRLEGKVEEAQRIAQGLLHIGIDIDKIAELTGLSDSKIKQLQELL